MNSHKKSILNANSKASQSFPQRKSHLASTSTSKACQMMRCGLEATSLREVTDWPGHRLICNNTETTARLFNELTQKINIERKQQGQSEFSPEEVASVSRASFSCGPKIFGKYSGRRRPRNRLASVTVSVHAFSMNSHKKSILNANSKASQSFPQRKSHLASF
jgi:hypothetical protein